MVIAPRPMRETSRVPRWAFLTVPSFAVEVASGELMARSKARISRRWDPLLREVLAGCPTLPVPGSRLVVVETRNEVQDFLTSRRAAITPEQAGVPSYGARRVPGLGSVRCSVCGAW